MKLHSYKDYNEYRAAQIKANHDKIKNCWVRPETVDLICKKILEVCPGPKLGLCHGTRRGIEQALFKSYLKCEVIGTEISDTAEKFSDTIQWDFHIVKDEWVEACDFIYSNSLDHSYNPLGALEKWISCLTAQGLLVIEWVDLCRHNKRHPDGRPKKSTAVDPFAASTDEICDLITKAGGEVVEIKPIQYKKASRHTSSAKAHVSLIFARVKA
jgi:hypothetical protein